MAFTLEKLLRKNILYLKPYSSARDEFQAKAEVYLDANENPFGSTGLNQAYNRYPDPHQQALKQQIARLKRVAPTHIFLGNGSDEPIDLLIRAFCEPGQDSILITPPTYGMYEVSANINDVRVLRENLNEDFSLDILRVLQHARKEQPKLVFLCSPNNPTGNVVARIEELKYLAQHFEGIIVVDEAYIDFCDEREFSALRLLYDCPNVVVLQTFSKAWGLAALRLGMAFASEPIVQILNKIKPPYNINEYTQQAALHALQHASEKELMVEEIREQRWFLSGELQKLSFIEEIFPSETNFILMRVKNANELYEYLLKRQIVVRNRSNQPLCHNCLRVTVGTPEENELLLQALYEYTEQLY